MLLGEFHCTTDSEGRLILPSPLRPAFVEGATVTRGIERCLLVYPTAEWRRLGEKMQRLPYTSQSARSFARLIFSGAARYDTGHAGHLLLPDQLRSYAHIEDEAVVVGLLSHAEIWCPEWWRETKSSFVEAGVAVAEALSEFGV